MRPLWFEYPDDSRTYLIEDEYLVGSDLLVAPVVTESVTKRHVYFPSGDDWIDWWTGKRYEGGRDADVEAPLDRLPLFARAGAVIPTIPVIQHTGEREKVSLTLVAAPGGPDQKGTIRQDNLGYGMLYPIYADWRDGKLWVSQNTSANSALTSPDWVRVKYVEFLGLPEGTKGVLVDGQPPTRKPDFDKDAGRLRVGAPQKSDFYIALAP